MGKKILEPGRNCMGIYPAGEAGLLIDARDYYMAFYRAALKAERYIAIAGWEFDSEVRLLRGADTEAEGTDAAFLAFLRALCDANPDLCIYILAWDFSALYAFDREWFQKWLFTWNYRERIHFRFDSAHPVAASHHQKMAVIDGTVAFAGGLDICQGRWDDRGHLARNPRRVNTDGKPYEAYHDIQSVVTGEAAAALAGVFEERWETSGGQRLNLPSPPGHRRAPAMTLPVGGDRVAISRTRGRILVPERESLSEIRRMFLDAVASAEELIYVENQYFSSQAVYKALLERFRDRDRPPLEVVFILPKEPHALIEQVSMGLAQIKMLETLREHAAAGGHSLGIYYCLARGGAEEGETPVYIHAKLLSVDDRFLTVGSANLTNRSMGLDTELNLAWEADGSSTELGESIRNIRADLIAEHAGIDDPEGRREAGRRKGLVSWLDGLASDPAFLLRRHTLETMSVRAEWLRDLRPEDLSVDPEKPVIEENLYEIISRDQDSLFAKGMRFVNGLLSKKRPRGGGGP